MRVFYPRRKLSTTAIVTVLWIVIAGSGCELEENLDDREKIESTESQSSHSMVQDVDREPYDIPPLSECARRFIAVDADYSPSVTSLGLDSLSRREIVERIREVRSIPSTSEQILEESRSTIRIYRFPESEDAVGVGISPSPLSHSSDVIAELVKEHRQAIEDLKRRSSLGISGESRIDVVNGRRYLEARLDIQLRPQLWMLVRQYRMPFDDCVLNITVATIDSTRLRTAVRIARQQLLHYSSGTPGTAPGSSSRR